MTADRMERVREQARKLEHAGYYAAETELIVKGAEMFRTLTDAEWEQTREKVARDHFAAGAEIAAKYYGLDEPVSHDGLGERDHAQLLIQAEAAMRAVGLRREGE